ncbi:adenylate/guanylate cyclase domain-containing protein [Legionella norrlandica]|uniref:adenylate/guanylate cyclase domain-containing protein n=1 Tax=Legionella norrlandica TaxID=1498499 RepID=UPI000A550BA7|nr:adenylate/guanylate cyclase domain-containing protein [Legionella norrlandica]
MSSLDKIAGQIDNDQQFVNALLDKSVVLGFLFHHDNEVKKGALPPPLTDAQNNYLTADNLPIYRFYGFDGSLKIFIEAATKAGFVTNLPDKDGTVRHALVLANYNNYLYPSLPLAIVMNYLLINHVDLIKHKGQLTEIQLDGIKIPVNAKAQLLIPFWGKAGTLNYYSATDILNNKFNPDELVGSIAVIGSSMTLLSDLHQSPVAQLFPGVELVGNIVKAIIAQQIIAEFNWHSMQGLIYFILFGIILTLLFLSFGVIGKFIITLIVIVGILVGAISFLMWGNIYVPPASLLILVTLQALLSFSYSYFIERRQKRKISYLFGQYVPEEYVKELIESPEQYSMEGETRDMSVLFIDIVNFTTLSESLDAIEVKHLLNTFFTPITKIIFEHRGTIDKYVGDMVIAFWGAPIEDKDHAYHALMATFAIFDHLPGINAQMKEQGLPTVDLCVGIASGPMNVGDMGSEFRRAYTVLGDTVNLGSRLQDLTRFYQVKILVNEATRANQNELVWRPIDKVTVKGRKSALTIYQPLGIVTKVSPEVLMELELYQNALRDYYKQNWSEAESKFTELKKQRPEIYLYHMYLERIKAFKNNPPPKDWNGVYFHMRK